MMLVHLARQALFGTVMVGLWGTTMGFCSRERDQTQLQLQGKMGIYSQGAECVCVWGGYVNGWKIVNRKHWGSGDMLAKPAWHNSCWRQARVTWHPLGDHGGWRIRSDIEDGLDWLGRLLTKTELLKISSRSGPSWNRAQRNLTHLVKESMFVKGWRSHQESMPFHWTPLLFRDEVWLAIRWWVFNCSIGIHLLHATSNILLL